MRQPVSTRVRSAAIALICFLLAVPLDGQAGQSRDSGFGTQGSAIGSLESLRQYVGKPIVVHDVADARVSGRLLEASSAGLALSVNGIRRDIAIVEIASVGVVGDSIWDGVLKGLGIGALFTWLGHSDVSGCEKPCFRDSALSDALGIGLVGALGGWIDSRRTKETLVYQKP
jgi:hypothetical protein